MSYRRGALSSLRFVATLSSVGVYRSDCQDDPAERQRLAVRRYRQNNPARVQIDNNRRAQQQAELRAENPNYDHNYRVAHPAQVQIDNNRRAEQQAEVRAENPNHDRDYREAHPDYVLRDNERRAEQHAAERAANPSYDRDYRQANPDYVRRDNERRAAAHTARQRQRAAMLGRCALVNIDDRPAEDPTIDPTFTCGAMAQFCQHCDAWFWALEANKDGTYTRCCSNGAIRLPFHDPPFMMLENVLMPDTDLGKVFHKKARHINTCLAFTSTTLKTHEQVTRGEPTLRMSGSIYHRLGPVLPNAQFPTASFLQTFFVQSEPPADFSAAEVRLINDLRDEMKTFNPFLDSLQQGMDRIAPLEQDQYKLILTTQHSHVHHRGVYNLPTCAEVGMVAVGDGPAAGGIDSRLARTVHVQGGPLQFIQHDDPSYDPLSYPLQHPRGETGYHQGLRKAKVVGGVLQMTEKKMSAMEFYRWKLHTRDGPVYVDETVPDDDSERWKPRPSQRVFIDRDAWTYGGRLFEQLVCDSYCKVTIPSLTLFAPFTQLTLHPSPHTPSHALSFLFLSRLNSNGYIIIGRTKSCFGE